MSSRLRDITESTEAEARDDSMTRIRRPRFRETAQRGVQRLTQSHTYIYILFKRQKVKTERQSARLAPPARFPWACDQGAGAGDRRGGAWRGRHVEDGPSPRAASQCVSTASVYVCHFRL